MKFRVFWDVALCSHVEVDRRFRGAYYLHHQGATSQKTLNFILAAVRTWTVTWCCNLHWGWVAVRNCSPSYCPCCPRLVVAMQLGFRMMDWFWQCVLSVMNLTVSFSFIHDLCWLCIITSDLCKWLPQSDLLHSLPYSCKTMHIPVSQHFPWYFPLDQKNSVKWVNIYHVLICCHYVGPVPEF
jgi:hypothetical protein